VIEVVEEGGPSPAEQLARRLIDASVAVASEFGEAVSGWDDAPQMWRDVMVAACSRVLDDRAGIIRLAQDHGRTLAKRRAPAASATEQADAAGHECVLPDERPIGGRFQCGCRRVYKVVKGEWQALA
jgi:hypothetical protein